MLTGEICFTQRGVSAAAWLRIRLLPRKHRGGDQDRLEYLFGICRFKEKARWLPISYAFWRSFGIWPRGNLCSVCRIYSKNIYQWWLGAFWSWLSEHVPDDSPFGTLQMRSKAFCRIWMSTRVPASMAYHRSFWITVHLLSQNYYIFFFIGLWQRTFFPSGEKFHTLLRYSKKVYLVFAK
jgi:hypothetical protein